MTSVAPSGATHAGAAPEIIQRIQSIDLLRGLVIVIMALDHVRDFFTPTTFMPEDLSQTDGPLFLTRWVTHFCAPVFVFLAGTSAYLHGRRLDDRGALARFLITRGLWLVVLELLVVNPSFIGAYGMAFGQVIWVLGWSMVVLAGLVWLPKWLIALFGFGLVLGHNLLDPVTPEQWGGLGWLWHILHVPGWIPLSENPQGFGFWVAYPLIPWLGVMALGYLAGQWFEHPAAHRRRMLLLTGSLLCLLFVVLRLGNFYGDASSWSSQEQGTLFSLFSFINTTKYPPSLLFLMMTLGPALILLGLLERVSPARGNPLLVFGQVPLFFYLLHVPLIHFCGWLYMTATYGSEVHMMRTQAWPEAYSPQLWRTYVAWLVLSLVLYLLCLWYRGLKMRHRDSLLRFL